MATRIYNVGNPLRGGGTTKCKSEKKDSRQPSSATNKDNHGSINTQQQRDEAEETGKLQPHGSRIDHQQRSQTIAPHNEAVAAGQINPSITPKLQDEVHKIHQVMWHTQQEAGEDSTTGGIPPKPS